MIFRQITSDGDWTFGKGVSGYAINEAAVELNVRTRLLSWKGNCFFDLNAFVDWLGRLDKGQQENLNRELRNVILQSFGVVSVNSLVGVLDRATRHYLVTYNISTIFGENFINTLDQAAGVPTGS